MSSGKRTSVAEYAVIVLAVVLGGVVLGFRLGWQGYWWDEEVTLMFTRLSWRELFIEHWALDTHRPVYYGLQKAWNEVVGETVAAVRGLPVVLTLLIVPLFFRIAREVGGRDLAILTVLLLITSPMFWYQGRELRMYCLLNLSLALALLFSILLAKHILSGSGRQFSHTVLLIIGFSTSLALAFYAQAVGIVVAVLFAVWGLLAVFSGFLPKQFLETMLYAGILYLSLVLPALWPFFYHYSETVGETFWVPKPSLRIVYEQTMGVFPYPKWTKPPILLFLLWGVWCMWQRRPMIALLLVLLMFGLPLLVLGVSFFKPLYLVRVIAWSGFVSVIFLAAGLVGLRPIWRWSGALLITIAQISHLASAYPRHPAPSISDTLAYELDGFKSAHDVLILENRAGQEPILRWYYPAIFDGTVYGFARQDRRDNVIDAAFSSIFIPQMEAGLLSLSAQRLFILREKKPASSMIPISTAIETLIAGRLLDRVVESEDGQRLEVYVLP